MREMLDIDINDVAATAVGIIRAYLTGYRARESQVNELYKLIRGEFSKDESIKIFDKACGLPEDSESWEPVMIKLAERMKINPVLTRSVGLLVERLRPPIVEPAKLSSRMTILCVLLSLAGILLSGWMPSEAAASALRMKGLTPALNYILVAIFMLALLLVIGMHTTGRPAGVLINRRKLMSLSRFQMVLWTVIILSAYFSIALLRIRSNVPDALGIGIDWRLWALMGISTASLVGTPLITDSKKDKNPSNKSLSQASRSLEQSADVLDGDRAGLLYANPSIANASFTDLFEGDEIANTSFVDLSKVQMFLFTLIVAFAYLAQILELMNRASDPASLKALPSLSEGLIGILLISHAGYLTNKTVSRTEVSPQDS
jgi:hypothetical protein